MVEEVDINKKKLETENIQEKGGRFEGKREKEEKEETVQNTKRIYKISSMYLKFSTHLLHTLP